MQKRIVILCTIMAVLCISVFGILFYFSNETADIENQEQAGQLAAEEYLIHVSQQEVQQEDDTEEISDLDYNDNEIYATFTEGRAWGRLDCVLEIPAIDLRQSIYIGTYEQIDHDLSNWLAVAARPHYVLGGTQYCIYMHNPRNKSIKISYAQENLKEGDYMVVTQNNMVYFYEVTGVFAEWRNKCADLYIDSKTVSSDMLYIFTCGRDEWQGRNVVIEGTVRSTYSTTDWNENKDKYIKEYKKSLSTNEDEDKESLVMMVEAQNEHIVVSLSTENYKKVDGCSIAVLNADGYLIDNFENPIKYDGEEIVLPKLSDGEYYIGIYENNTEYKDPTPYQINITTELNDVEAVALDEMTISDKKEVNIMRTVAIVMLGLAISFGLITIIRVSKNNGQ